MSQELLDELDDKLVEILNEAARCFIDDLRTRGSGEGMPLDTGRLRQGIIEKQRNLDDYSITIESVAQNNGTDYPAIIDAGYPSSKWEGWWDDQVANNSELWDRCVSDAAVKVGLV